MDSRKPRPSGAAFLLAQLGAHAAERFGERIQILGITPPHAGILRLIALTPSCNQQALAKRIGVLPSRMVMLIDELTERKLVKRGRSQKDRRHSELVLTKAGHQMFEKISKLAAEHEADLCAALTQDEKTTLAALCQKIADQQGLTSGVHPGYRKL
jgi:DNA-binding MarR family transcriptional regulator